MNNISRALILAASMLLFIIGFSYSMYLINKLYSTSRTLLDTVTQTKYYDNIKVGNSSLNNRIVGIDTVISTLYRYYKEGYSVKIFASDGTLLQLFDTKIETKISAAASYTGNDKNNVLYKLKDSVYNDKDKAVYMFEAPWTENINEYTVDRINYFINGTEGYINNSFVDYSGIDFYKNYKNSSFIETFAEYTYSGETISTANGLETITGNTQEKNKIVITYQIQEI